MRPLSRLLLAVTILLASAGKAQRVRPIGHSGTDTNRTIKSTEQTLEDVDNQWGQATVRVDMDKLRAILTDDYVSMGSDGKVVDKDQQLRYIEDEFRPITNPSYSADEYRVWLLDEHSALMVHRATSSGLKSGQPTSETHRSLHVFVKRKGHWQAIASVALRLSSP